jgi:hypothetical protein
MKTTIAALSVLALAGTYCMASNPADPALNGLTPRTPTFYLNNIGVGTGGNMYVLVERQS